MKKIVCVNIVDIECDGKKRKKFHTVLLSSIKYYYLYMNEQKK